MLSIIETTNRSKELLRTVIPANRIATDKNLSVEPTSAAYLVNTYATKAIEQHETTRRRDCFTAKRR